MAAPDVARPLVFSNVETVVIGFLAGRAELAGAAVAARLPVDYDGAARAVTVSRVGGEFAVDDLLDRALVRIDTYGPDKGAALDLAGAVRGLIWSMPDSGLADGAVVSDVAESRGPSWLRDPAYPSANRYTTRYLLHLRVGPRPD